MAPLFAIFGRASGQIFKKNRLLVVPGQYAAHSEGVGQHTCAGTCQLLHTRCMIAGSTQLKWRCTKCGSKGAKTRIFNIFSPVYLDFPSFFAGARAWARGRARAWARGLRRRMENVFFFQTGCQAVCTSSPNQFWGSRDQVGC